jgi:3-oxoacyl-[acyl-carrier protein] reductase
MPADVVIRGGSLVDGTGAPARVADIALSDGVVSDIGQGLDGKRVLEADGNVVAPGFIDTDMTRAMPEEAKNGLIDQIALGRLGEPADIAHAVAFLAGPSASYITGETLHVNGGMYMP